MPYRNGEDREAAGMTGDTSYNDGATAFAGIEGDTTSWLPGCCPDGRPSTLRPSLWGPWSGTTSL